MSDTIAHLRRDGVPLLKDTWQNFNRHNGTWMAAALAYFTAFAIAPLIIILVEIAGMFLGGHQSALNAIYGYMQRDAGGGAAGAIRSIVTATFNQPRSGIIAQTIGWVVFLIAAIGLFSAVQFALNNAWDVDQRKLTWKDAIRERGIAFGVMLGIALLMFASMLANTMLTVAGNYLSHVFTGFATLLKIADFAVTFGVIWLAFALLFEYLPECRIEWRDVWAGAGITAFLFVTGQFLLGWYLGRAGLTSGFGAFGSLVAFLIWVNYSSQIMLLGAEFTHAYALRHGSKANQAQTTRGEIISEGRPLYPPRQTP